MQVVNDATTLAILHAERSHEDKQKGPVFRPDLVFALCGTSLMRSEFCDHQITHLTGAVTHFAC